ncbi:hypothetical protein QYF36_005462 [Acer negundo]|nr:hypothetical protein QYF36_005462 [Acer negundo]
MDGMYKVNNDDALDSIVHHIGAGFTQEVIEALAILRRVSLVVDADLVPVVVEFDFLWLVNHINASSLLAAGVGLVVSDILQSIRIRPLEFDFYTKKDKCYCPYSS